MPKLNQAELSAGTLAEDYVTTAGFSQIDAQRKQEFLEEQIQFVLNESSCRADASS